MPQAKRRKKPPRLSPLTTARLRNKLAALQIEIETLRQRPSQIERLHGEAIRLIVGADRDLLDVLNALAAMGRPADSWPMSKVKTARRMTCDALAILHGTTADTYTGGNDGH